MSEGAAPAVSVSVSVSVIICTRDRAALLRRTLESLLADCGGAGREVIVVDNGSTDDTAAVVSTIAAAGDAGGPAVRRVAEPRPGKSRALNAGISAARGEYLLFTDDDVLVTPGWTAALTAALRGDGVVAAGGRTLPDWEAERPSWLDDRLLRDLGVRDLGLRAVGVAGAGASTGGVAPEDVIGANMGLRASALAGMAGPFDERLGPRGGLKVDYEEFDLLQRLAGTGTIIYAPEALVMHRVPASRATWTWMRRTYFQRGFGKARHARGTAGSTLPSWVARVRLCRHNYWVARTLRRRNRGTAPGPAEATAEFQAYLDFGHDLDMVLARFPRLAGWAAGLPV